ncbi:transposase, IS4 family protein [Nostoc punctiforme PCC 73102]|uniref:Transposase, IS4 family protein n=1 Tax=Nostoc punctiforme (strain ATCC 29133 / PCC 73102) TaxID=63737 RepID=B2IY89_NOSP7|nr:transposase, IS4 family protein [Nostoc punctiforme PCC 73102]
MLPELYQKHLQSLLSQSELIFLTLVINVVQNIKDVKLEKISESRPLFIQCQSRRKKLQRFLSLPILNIEELWFPIIERWLAQTFLGNHRIYLAIDRTNWKRKNLLMISVIFQKRAIPIYFKLLAKLGSSNLSEQTKALSKIIPLFKNYKTVVLGDREFCSVSLAKWLDEQGFEFCLRLKKNENIELKAHLWCEIKDLGLKPGTSFFVSDATLTKTKQVKGFNVACKWKKNYRQNKAKEGWFILTNMNSKITAIPAYQKRFDIEEMFRDFKSGGYNLEKTNVEGKRFIALVLIISLAYTIATLQGQNIKSKGIAKYVARPKEYGRSHRRHSNFYIGLYAQNWVNFIGDCWSLVQDLMRLSRHKLENYLQGMRAMKLIQSAL